MGLVLLAISILLLFWVARACARGFGQTPGERFWIGVAAAGLQLGAIAIALSVFRLLTPLGWLGAQGVLLVATTMITHRRMPPRPGSGGLLGEMGATSATKLATLAVLAIVLVSFAERFALPVREFDDRMYHGSRAAYWLQHRSVFGFTTHNERQVSFPFGGELWFFWPLLFTRSEMAGQLGFGLSLPLMALGAFWTLREAGASRNAAALGVVTLCFAPMVLYHARGLRTELWAALYATGCAFWAIRALRDAQQRLVPLVLAGLCFALAVNVKATTLPMALGLVVLALIGPRKPRAFAAVALGVVAGLILSGFVATAAYNWHTFGHPLGSNHFRAVHAADISPSQLRTHAARATLSLVDPPVAPDPLARALESAGASLLKLVYADAPLPREKQSWPGPYVFHVEPFAGNYSLAGLAWVPLLVVALVLVARDVARSWPRVALSSTSMLALLAAPMLLAPVFMLRWTEGVPRFWVPAYALGVLVFVPMLDQWAAPRKWRRVACAVALALMALPAAFAHASRSWGDLQAKFSPVGLEEPFFEPLAHIDDGSTILLAGVSDVRDYPLFAPGRGFANRVVSWGSGPFDATRMRTVLDEDRVTHVIVQTEPPVDFAPMVNWLTAEPDFAEITLPYTPRMRLFARRGTNGPPATTPIR